jgi:hypothetical protein
VEIAWAAGFYEGEGSCSYAAGSFRLSIPQVNLEPLERIHRYFGGGLSINSRGISSVQIYGKRGVDFAVAIYPHLSQRRQKQIREKISQVAALQGMEVLGATSANLKVA